MHYTSMLCGSHSVADWVFYMFCEENWQKEGIIQFPKDDKSFNLNWKIHYKNHTTLSFRRLKNARAMT